MPESAQVSGKKEPFVSHLSKQIMFGIALVILSALTYYIHFLIFRDPHHIFIFMVGEIGRASCRERV